MKKIQFCYCVVALVAVACESVFVDVPQDPPVLAINTVVFIPDSACLIRIGRSYPVAGERRPNDSVVTNATVTISDTFGETFDATYVTNGKLEGYYRSLIKPKIATSYFLEVSAPGYPTATATTTLPVPVEIMKVEIDSAKILDAQQKLKDHPGYVDLDDFTYCDITFTDPAGEKNYYEVRAYLTGESQDTNANGQPFTKSVTVEVDVFSDDPVVDDVVTKSGGADPKIVVFDDAIFNGKLQKLRIRLNTFYFYLPQVRKIDIALRSLTTDYFLYIKSLSLQQSVAEDPFAQPVQFHNNIQNGLGNFGGYSQSVFELVKK